MQYLVSSDLVINIDADFECSFSETIITELTAEACDKAYKQAQMLAKCSGEEIDRLFAISTSGLDNLAMRFKISDLLSKGDISIFGSSMSISEDVFFVPDAVEYTASVSAIYKLK